MAREKFNKASKATAEGSHHWLSQRYTAIANLFLVPWLIVSGIMIHDGSYLGVIDFIKVPLNSFFLIMFMFNAFYHGTLGITVVVEDYVHNKIAKWSLLIATKLGSVLFGSLAVFSIINIYFNV